MAPLTLPLIDRCALTITPSPTAAAAVAKAFGGGGVGLGVSIGTPKLHSPSPKSPKDLAALAAPKEESPRILLEDVTITCTPTVGAC